MVDGTSSPAATDTGRILSIGSRINDYADREPRRFAILALVLFMLPLLALFLWAFIWAVTEFFEPTPSYTYYFWLALVLGGGGAFFIAAASWDLWNKRIGPNREEVSV